MNGSTETEIAQSREVTYGEENMASLQAVLSTCSFPAI